MTRQDSRRGAARLTAGGLLFLLTAVGARTEPRPSPDLPRDTRAFLEKHCIDCHDPDVKKGGLDLTSLEFDPSRPELFDRWVKVHDKVRDGEMPPKKKKRPAEDERTEFLAALRKPLEAADRARQQARGRGVIRRLNRAEFETAVSDLLGVPLRIRELLPPDAEGAGFDTVGAALNVSAVQMEAYLEALDVALDSATTLIERPETRKWRLNYRETAGMMMEYRRGGPFLPVPDGVAMFAPDFFSHFNSLLDHYVVAHSARYRVKVSAYALRTEEPVTLTVRMGGPGHKESDEVPKKLLGNVSVKTGDSQVFAFEDHLERGQMFRIYPSSLRKMRFAGKKWERRQKEYRGPAVVVQWVEVEGPIYDSWPPASHERLYAGVKREPIPGVKPNLDPNAHLKRPPGQVAKPRMTRLKTANKQTGNKMVYDPNQGVGGEKIYRRTRVREPLRSTMKLVPDRPKADADRLLRSFVPAAFRRPVEEAEIQPYLRLAHRWLDAGVEFEQVIRFAYKAVLTSPGFLYHRGGRPVEIGKPELKGHELAERLAFFLWNGMPDASLAVAASKGKLQEPAGLRSEVDRMLRDPRADRFLIHFLDQWLDLQQIDFTSPDSDLYPEFDDLLQWSMVEETRAFFRELLQEDLGVRNVIDSEFAMLNDRLAKHYGIPGVEGVSLRKVTLPEGSMRGGVLAQGSVLKVTANGTTTSPVVRGTWVLERIMGMPPDPPPPGVPAIEPDIRGATTVRDQLAQHRTMERCAGCHAKIDPPGVALEAFDVIGGLRKKYRALDPKKTMERFTYNPGAPPPIRYHQGLPVDASDVLPDGRKFGDVREFKKALLTDPDQIARAVASKLVTYATGAPISFADRAEIDRIVSRTRPGGHGFRSLIEAVVESPLFQRK